MNGDDFFSLAVRLSSGSSPVELRTSISRAYYAAYHHALDFLASIGIELPRGPESHTKVQYVLEQAGDAALLDAVAMLFELRKARNRADYELSNQEVEKKFLTVRSLKNADIIIACLKSHLPNGQPNAMHETLRRYAKDVLRLAVR